MYRVCPTAFAILAVAAPTASYASRCEDSVTKTGSIFEGRRFSGNVQIPGLSKESALTQLRAIFQVSHIALVHEDMLHGKQSAQIGGTTFAKPISIEAAFGTESDYPTVHLTYSMAPGEMSDGHYMRTHICSILTQLRGSKGEPPASWEGAPKPQFQTINQTANLAAPMPQTPAIEARDLARQIVWVMNNPARLDADFVGRWYRVRGSVLKIESISGGYAVWFEGEPQSADQRIGLEPPGMAIRCFVAQSKIRAAANLSVGKIGTLVGLLTRIDDDPRAPAVILEKCDGPQQP